MCKIYIFEGPDMCGKTTQLHHVKEKLIESGLKVETFKFPDKDNLCGKESYDVLNKSNLSTKDALELMMYDVVNKMGAACEKIIKAAKVNDVILIDRFILSALAYNMARISILFKNDSYDLTAICYHLFNKLLLNYYKRAFYNEGLIFDPVTIVFLKNDLIPHLIEDESETNRRFDATDNNKELQEKVAMFYDRISNENNEDDVSLGYHFIRNSIDEKVIDLNKQFDSKFGLDNINKKLILFLLNEVEDSIVKMINEEESMIDKIIKEGIRSTKDLLPKSKEWLDAWEKAFKPLLDSSLKEDKELLNKYIGKVFLRIYAASSSDANMFYLQDYIRSKYCM